MSDEWSLAQRTGERLAKLSFFAVTKELGGKPVEVKITVAEYAETDSHDRSMRFCARADTSTAIGDGAFHPCGWGPTLVKALQECIREIDRFADETAS